MRVLGLITARGGSKGLPGKNIRPLLGRPLIAYTIDCARALGERLSSVVVSTDDPAIADVAHAYGAEIPFMRPAELARDDTPSLAVVRHAVEFLEKRDGQPFDWILLLQPTSPLRTAQDLGRLLDAVADGTPSAAVLVREAAECHPLKLRRIEEGWLVPWIEGAPEAVRRQDLAPMVYRTNGAGYLSRRDLVVHDNSLYGTRVRAVTMPEHRSIDIDDEIDFAIAEMLLAKSRGEAQ